jgi:hypothetical protein
VLCTAETLIALLCLVDHPSPSSEWILREPQTSPQRRSIAVLNLSVKVASLYLQNSRHVRNTNDDMDQLHQEATNLETVSEYLTKLLNSLISEDLRVPGR